MFPFNLFRKKKLSNRNKLAPGMIYSMPLYKKLTFMVSSAPESQVADRIVDEANVLLNKDTSERDYYLWLDKIYNESCCDTSSFIKALVNVRAYYPEPIEGKSETVS